MNPLTVSYRRQQAALRAVAVLALRRVWPALDPERLDDSFPGWAAAVTELVRTNRLTAAALAARYASSLRLDMGLPGLAPTVAVRPLPAAVLLSSLGVAGPVAIKSSMTRGVPLPQAVESAFVLSANSATRHILDAGRETLLASVQQDEQASGWRRVSSGRSCKFCNTLVGRGEVHSARTADFPAHDGCGCSIEPVYR